MKNWKRTAVPAMSAVMAGVILIGCGGGGKITEAAKGNEPKVEADARADKDTGEATDSSGKKRAYVFIHDRGNLSYWDSMATGGDRAVADYADRAGVHVVETTVDLQANLQAMYEAADKGVDLIITASDFRDNLAEIANEYSDIALTIISEGVIDQCENNDAYGVGFTTSQTVLLGGIAAADVATNDAEDMDLTNVIGFIGGMDESLVIQEFLWGYIQGAQYYNLDVKIVYNYVGAWNDSGIAKTQAMTQYNDTGADVISVCADGSGNGVHNTAEEAQKFVIGADSDQFQLYEDDKTIQEKFLTPVAEEVNNAVYNVIGEYLGNGTLPHGEYEVPGLSDDAIGIMEGGQLNGALPDEGKVKLEEAKAGIVDGSTEVKSVIGKGQDEVKVFINGNCQQGKKRQPIGMLKDWKKKKIR